MSNNLVQRYQTLTKEIEENKLAAVKYETQLATLNENKTNLVNQLLESTGVETIEEVALFISNKKAELEKLLTEAEGVINAGN